MKDLKLFWSRYTYARLLEVTINIFIIAYLTINQILTGMHKIQEFFTNAVPLKILVILVVAMFYPMAKNFDEYEFEEPEDKTDKILGNPVE